MKNLFILYAVPLWFIWLPLKGQEQKGQKFSDFFEDGVFTFQTRSVFMGTNNKGDLTDFYTLGVGAGLGYSTPSIANFKFVFSGFFIWQLYEQNLTNPAVSNRYELALYDMNDPENNKNLDRLEQLFLEYQHKTFLVRWGRQKINSPLLNEQDNRMRPNLYTGLYSKFEKDKFSVEAGWFTHVSPRGTVKWYSIENSIGVYPVGRGVDGAPSAYKDNITSKGLGLLGLMYNLEKTQFQLWNYYVDHIFNLSFAQADFQIPAGSILLLGGIQGFYQTAVKNGGNDNHSLTYMMPGNRSTGLGFRAGVQKGGHEITANYFGLSDQGRYLFPREWGREIFYASLYRERYEGSGATQGYSVEYKYQFPEKKLSTMMGVGSFHLPPIEQAELNKYGIASYYHFVGRIIYKPAGVLEGMKFTLFAIRKAAKNPDKLSDKDFMNKVGLTSYNITIDYKFNISKQPKTAH